MTATAEEVKKTIVEIVNTAGPIKATELVVRVFTKHLPSTVPGSLLEILDECVKEGLVIETEYVVPRMPDRVKSLYWPRESHIISRGITK